MGKKLFLILLLLLPGCGYTTQGHRYAQKRIRITPVVNKINIARESRRYSGHTSYPVLIENKLTNRLVFDFNARSNLEVVSQPRGALVLDCKITDYQRSTLRFSDSDDPLEQRLRLHVDMTLKDPDGQIINQRNIVGQTTFYLADKGELAAQNELVEDVSRRITEAVVEAW